ncbi:HTH domain-containing protein [[Clostridium] sordellii]|uniref:helix-turn-helix domain-containing protein n=1 Tax=Paraclostridium sordellii TaxID=1505 RepID=UPI0005E51F8C|nr:helix-turn-helix domain-containing protein [Paeniclostridium sordellii]CEO04828.1 HTH domain-containing protein [[Clostridium] sordellii] [Paeniclostridium sordellii]
MEKKVLTPKDIQKILGVCEKTAYNLIKQAQTTGDMFKVIKIGRLYKIPSQPFLDWLDHWDGF